MNPQLLIQELKSSKEYFDRSTSVLTEDDAGFAPAEGLMTVAQQVAHVAQTVDWLLDGAVRKPGEWDMDFEKHAAEAAKVTSLAEARSLLGGAWERAEKDLGARTAEELAQPIPEGPVMGGAPRGAVVGAIADHTSHHRGVLTVYARLRGHVPPMPYM